MLSLSVAPLGNHTRTLSLLTFTGPSMRAPPPDNFHSALPSEGLSEHQHTTYSPVYKSSMNLGLSHQESLVQKSLVLRRINQHSIQLNSQSLILYILNTIEHVSLSQCHPQSNLSIPDLLILFPVGCPGLTPFAI